jgi:hypothetical protein
MAKEEKARCGLERICSVITLTLGNGELRFEPRDITPEFEENYLISYA